MHDQGSSADLLNAVAFASARGLSSERWEIGTSGKVLMTAEQAADKVRSAAVFLNVAIAVCGVLMFSSFYFMPSPVRVWAAGIGFCVVMSSSLLWTFVLARYRRPIILRSSDGSLLLEMSCLTRVGLAFVTWGARVEADSRTYRIRRLPMRDTWRIIVEIQASDGERYLIREPSLAIALRCRAARMLPLAAVIAGAADWKHLRFDVLDGHGDRIASLVPDRDEPRWTWLLFDNPGANVPGALRAVVLGASLLAAREET